MTTTRNTDGHLHNSDDSTRNAQKAKNNCSLHAVMHKLDTVLNTVTEYVKATEVNILLQSVKQSYYNI